VRLPFFHLDVFATEAFAGNPAGVVPLDAWLDERTLQAIAVEQNLPATAFFVRQREGGRIRWFTPQVELELCGHATMASAWVLFERLEPGRSEVRFDSRTGSLSVSRAAERLVLDFPALPAKPCEPPPGLVEALGITPRETHRAADLLVVLESEDDVRSLRPDLAALAAIDTRGVIVTAPGHEVDYVSRFFAPRIGIAEDSATGSSHCTLAPYWAARLGQGALHDRQLSARGGEFWCEMADDRVRIAGHVCCYLEGTIAVP